MFELQANHFNYQIQTLSKLIKSTTLFYKKYYGYGLIWME